MHKITLFMSQLIALLCLLFFPGCGGAGLPGGKTMEIPELGFSMNIPDGWSLDNPQMCHQGNNTGLLMEEKLEGQSFEACATKMSREFGSTVIAESSLTINGCKAIKAAVNTPGGDRLVRVYIHKGENIIMVSFVILKDDYPANEAALQQSIHSITIK